MVAKHESQAAEEAFAPLKRVEATFHLAPAFQHLENASLGESEPYPFAPAISSADQPTSPMEQIEKLFWRPHMFFDKVDNLRDMMLLVEGYSRSFGHSFQGESEFAKHVDARYAQLKSPPWTTTLLNAFSDRPFLDACQEIAQLIRDWRRAATS